IDRGAAGDIEAEGNAWLGRVYGAAAGIEIGGGHPAVRAGLADVAPRAVATLHIDLLAAAGGVDNGIIGAGAGAHIHIARNGPWRSLGCGKEDDDGSGGDGNAGGEIEQFLAGVAVHDDPFAPILAGVT